MAQLRHMRLAEWSYEAAVEDQEHIFLSLQGGERKSLPIHIHKAEIWGGLI
jgi:hypothetical protein